MKRMFKIFVGIVAVVGLTLLVYVVSSKQDEINCIGMDINIEYPEQDVFIEKAEVEQVVRNIYQNLFSTAIQQINTEKLEKLFLQNPYVKSADVYSTIQGELIINLKQRQPILRIDSPRQSIYVDNYGSFMPLSPKYVSRVVIVNGHLEEFDSKKHKNIYEIESSASKELTSVYRLVKYIRKNPFLNALIEQIYMNKNREFEFIPKLGRQYILFGKANRIEEKFKNIQLFYEQGMKINGWDAYKMINVKYKNQIVCTKI